MYNKVYFVVDTVSNYSGNLIESLKRVKEVLKTKKIESVFVLPTITQQREWTKDIDAIYVDFTYTGLYKFAKSVKEEAIFHLNFIDNKKVMALRLGANNNIKYVYHMHMRMDYDTYTRITLKNILKRIFLPVLYKDFILVSSSPTVYKDLTNEFPHGIVKNITNAIVLDRLETNKNTYKRKKQALMMGTLFEIKGVDLAASVWKDNKEISDSITLKIITHHIDEAKQKVGGEIDGVTYEYPRDDVKSLYYESELFLSPSRSEAFCYSIVEAAYCGCKVIATDIPGQDTLKDIPGIVWIEKDNKEQLSQAIIDSINKEIDYKEIKQYIKNHYSVDKWVDDVIKTYDECWNLK